jgi:catalase
MKTFLARHPETVRALAVIKSHPVSSGFDNSTYNSLDAFRFVNAAGTSVAVRWSMVSVQPFEANSTTQAQQEDKILFHTPIVRDGILDRMALWKVRARKL